jgi:YD repeat-containing protein
MKQLGGVPATLVLAILIPTSAATMPSALPMAPPAGLTLSLTSRPPYTIRGRLTLISANLSQAGAACAGRGGYADIQAGKPVTVTDATGRVIGVGYLTAGHRRSTHDAPQDGACDFEFAVAGIPEVDVYGIALEGRGALQYSLAEMKQQNWFVRLQLSAR